MGYDFLNLSPVDFEELSRDLIQKHFHLYLESFKTGKDGGIDFRCTKDKDLENEIIVQAKRYRDFNSLFIELKREVKKLPNLEPDRYILSTSAGLSPTNKDKIKKLFHPYITSTSDIIGKDDLNNLLGIYGDIESKHFKLWLSSTNILEKIFNAKVINQSIFEKGDMERTSKVYAENESFSSALKILKSNRVLIISGEPGIGKTTLARVLCMHFLNKMYEEFVFVSESIDEAVQFYKEGVKQVFLYDDFLGRNFLNNSLKNNEEKQIIRFIESIKKTDDKILIFTTREYILNQAKQNYDVFESNELELARYIIDLSSYTQFVRARILYNHIYFSDLPKPYIKELIKKRIYDSIINHRNYNPRIIETILKESWKAINREQLKEKIIDLLDNPEKVWKQAYELHISDFSKIVLLIVLTTGTPIFEDDLKKALKEFCSINGNSYNFRYNQFTYEKSLKELENTFIKIKADTKNNLYIDFQNPSITDFLTHYLESHNDLIIDIFSSAVFLNQFFHLFIYQAKFKLRGKILLKNNFAEMATNRIIEDFDKLKMSTLRTIRDKDHAYSNSVKKEIPNTFGIISIIAREFNLDKFSILKDFLVSKFYSTRSPAKIEMEYLKAIEKLKFFLQIDSEFILTKTYNEFTYIDNYEIIEKVKELWPEHFTSIILENEEKTDRIYDMIDEFITEFNDGYVDDAINSISIVCNIFNLEDQGYEYDLQAKLEERGIFDDSDFDRDETNFKKRTTENSIDELFNSLIN